MTRAGADATVRRERRWGGRVPLKARTSREKCHLSHQATKLQFHHVQCGPEGSVSKCFCAFDLLATTGDISCRSRYPTTSTKNRSTFQIHV